MFKSDNSITQTGFRALYEQVSESTVATISFSNPFFTPRIHHSAAYDTLKDIIYITFGLERGRTALNDLILYYPSNGTFLKKQGWSTSPSPR